MTHLLRMTCLWRSLTTAAAAGSHLHCWYVSKMSQDNKEQWRNSYSCVGEEAVFVTGGDIQLSTSLWPLEKLDPYNRINSWFTASYSVETTDSYLLMTLPIVMTPTSSVKLIVGRALVLRVSLALSIVRGSETEAAPNLKARLILIRSEFQNHREEMK